MSQQTFAVLSNGAIYSATVVYALAMLAHLLEWSAARKVEVRAEAAQAPALTGGAGSARGSAGVGAEPAVGHLPEAGVGGVAGRVGLSLTLLAFGLHAIGVVGRGLAAGRVPWGNMYEFATTGALAVIAVYLVLRRRGGRGWLGLLVTGFVTLVLGLAAAVLYVPAGPLVPALHSYWLAIHVSAAAVSGGAFTVGALASGLYLVRVRADRDQTASSLGQRLPPAVDIDRVAHRVHAFAFPLWTFAVLAGAIWAEHAWGRYWGWDPKEVWAFVTWVVYAGYLHARATAGWRGRRAAWVALAGYATFLFNFVGINLFGSGLHSYAGL